MVVQSEPSNVDSADQGYFNIHRLTRKDNVGGFLKPSDASRNPILISASNCSAITYTVHITLLLILKKNGRNSGGTRVLDLDLTRRKFIIIICTNVQDQVFLSHSHLPFLLCENSLVEKRAGWGGGWAMMCFLCFSVSLRIRVCAWFTTTFYKRQTFPWIILG